MVSEHLLQETAAKYLTDFKPKRVGLGICSCVVSQLEQVSQILRRVIQYSLNTRISNVLCGSSVALPGIFSRTNYFPHVSLHFMLDPV